VLTVLTVGLVVGPLRAQPADESRLKAGFLLRFAQFVEWPPEVERERSTLDLCVSGPSPPLDFLRDVVAGESIRSKPLVARQANRNNASNCQVLFVGGERASRLALLRVVVDRPVLTVSEAADFLDDGGIVQLRMVGSKVAFEVDAEAARRANIRLHSQLLRLALRVRGGTDR